MGNIFKITRELYINKQKKCNHLKITGINKPAYCRAALFLHAKKLMT